MSYLPPHDWKRRGKMVRKSDPIFKDARPTDCIIAVMGATGTGKSTFINRILGPESLVRDKPAVGHELKSCTSQLQPILLTPTTYPNLPREFDGRLIIVDTPGFDDTYEDDSEILRRISVWLAASYSDSMKLGGMIYMHEISQPRMSGTARANTEVFQKLCGSTSMSSVFLVTTKWDDVDVGQGSKREVQLAEKYWKDMIAGKAQQRRFMNDEKTGRAIISEILDLYMARIRGGQLTLQIQTELVNLQKIIPDTEAAKSLKHSLEDALKAQRQLAEDMKTNGDGGRYKEAQDQINKILGELRALKVSFPRRLLAALGGA
ncbi:hypothetical protein HYPSUDRAFT_133082 [Hypholoma sublateritium FD-334 SS-4]|uniref:G domain-containing protein n=1 Tax=Hypholoma sublateritium (strain FD-334 SS-4) TaxID=945553 RepID=A0A0D2P5R5_HYPSF|nr:hypothetical protein HYPSUDRAFT_133082 [Hypholoma sublateritium FD-334 SS-4]